MDTIRSRSDDKNKRIRTRLRNLRSFIKHARDISNHTEILIRSIRENQINLKSLTIGASLEDNVAAIRAIAGDSGDFVFRFLSISSLNRKAALVFIDGMADIELLNSHVIGQLTLDSTPWKDNDCLSFLTDTLISAASVSSTLSFEEGVEKLLRGDALLIVDGVKAFITIASRKLKSRSIEESSSEPNIRGPRDSFTEDLRTSITLIRRRLQNPNLVVKSMKIGVQSNTDVAVLYIRGLTDTKLVYQAENRLSKVNIDISLGAGTLEGIIRDHRFSPFPTMVATERPDKVVAGLVEGKIAIAIDGTPFCLIAPGVLNDFIQAGDDYYENWFAASIIRFTRVLSLFFSLATPAVYVAITTFHPGLIPTPLALTVAASRLGIPFPAFMEAFLLEAFLEVLLEAGVRLPKAIGPAVSIVGGLVIGDAAVRAGLVSPGLIIVIAFTAIANFSIPSYRLALTLRALRVPLLVLATSLGMVGVVLGMLAITIHLCLLESFGEPYLAPYTPRNANHLSDLKDSFVVAPSTFFKTRPRYLEPQYLKRQNRKPAERTDGDA